jgi:hypothetical protein
MYMEIKDPMSEQICIICFDKIEMNTFSLYPLFVQIAECNCKIIYHYNCLEKWLNKSPTCPICRINVNILQRKKNLMQKIYTNVIYSICLSIFTLIVILVFLNIL